MVSVLSHCSQAAKGTRIPAWCKRSSKHAFLNLCYPAFDHASELVRADLFATAIDEVCSTNSFSISLHFQSLGREPHEWAVEYADTKVVILKGEILADVSKTSPQTGQQVIDTYFMEHRAKLIDVAAYLDRIDRGQGPSPTDFRDTAFRNAIAVLNDGQTHRAKRILELLSDHSDDMPQSADGMKGAAGAVALSDGGAV